MNKFMLNITASSGEYYQGDCEDLVLPISGPGTCSPATVIETFSVRRLL